MKIRTATILDLERILEIYAYARTFMAQTGNPTQWGDGYPKKELLTKDIEQGQLYVMEEKNEIHGVFVFIIGADPTYEVMRMVRGLIIHLMVPSIGLQEMDR